MSDQYPDSGFSGQVDQGAPAQQQQAEPITKQNLCTRIFTNKACKCMVISSVFIIAPLLIGVIGIMCPIFLIVNKVREFLPAFIFSIYCLLFGILLLLVEFKIRIFGNIFVFLLSYFYKAIFIIFLGTLAMGGYQDVPKWQWIGYVVGSFIVVVGTLQIVVGCCDRTWAADRQKKMDETAAQYGWEAAPPLKPEPPPAQPQQNQYDNQYDQGYNNQVYNNQGYNNQGYNNQGYNNQGYGNQPPPQGYGSQPAPQGYGNQPPPQGYGNQPPPQAQNRGYDPNRSGVAAAAAMPETQRFAAQAGTTAARAYIGGASRDEAMNAAMSDPNVQRAAGDAIIAGARNDQVRGAAVQGVSTAASTSFSYAYDSMFD